MTDEDFVRAELRQELAAHTPDRTAMLNRIAANRAGPGRRPRGRTWQLAGAGLAVTAVLGAGGMARWALTGDSDAAAPRPAAPPPAVSGPAAPPSAATSPPSLSPASSSPAPAPSSPPPRAGSTPSPTAPVRGHPGDTKVEKGPLRSAGSVPAAGRSEVTLTSTAELTRLDLTIRLAPATDLTPRDARDDAPAGAVATSVRRAGDTLLYRFTLRAGRTLPAGTYVFAARYAGVPAGRDADDDTYEAYATATVDGENKRPHVYGNFSPAT